MSNLLFEAITLGGVSFLLGFFVAILYTKNYSRKNRSIHTEYSNFFNEEEISEMKTHIESYQNHSENNEFKLPSYYYMTIIRKVVAFSNRAKAHR